MSDSNLKPFTQAGIHQVCSNIRFSLDTCELVFLVIFIAEMLFKMFGLGFHTYFASAFNCFDFAVRDLATECSFRNLLTLYLVYIYIFLTP